MRIAFLGDGALNHVRRWVSYFHGHSHDVLLISFEDVSGCPFPAKRVTKRLPTKILGYLASLGPVKNLLNDFRPQLVNALYVGGYGLIGALSGHRPLAVSALGSDLLVDYPSSPLHRVQIRHAIRHADLVTTDADVLSAIVHDIGAPCGRILKAYFGVDEEIFHMPKEPRGQPGTGSGAPRIVSTRKLYPLYNIDLLIAAAPEIIEATGARIFVVGEGPERGLLERLAGKRGVRDHISFEGRMKTEGIVEELQNASVYVSTSRSDSTSVSLLEAMACGAPPVVTDIPANREWIEDSVNGILFTPGDRRALARAVITMVKDRDFARSVRERNVELVRERGLWQTNMSRVEQAFQRLAGVER
jgi:glycosyltransferase involved in cell wall biosynthesis